MRWSCILPLTISFAVFASSFAGCKAKQATKDEPKAAVVSEPPTSAEPVPGAYQASDEEKAMAMAFIGRLADAVETESPVGWEALHTTAQREQLIADDAVPLSFKAWYSGTFKVLDEMRKGEFVISKTSSGMKLTFPAIKVPNDPEATMSFAVGVEDGQMLINER